MFYHIDLSQKEVWFKIKHKEILLAGNKKLKIYGLLNCCSGKKIKRENRVFFTSKNQAISNHYRPCGHCMKAEYKEWILSKK